MHILFFSQILSFKNKCVWETSEKNLSPLFHISSGKLGKRHEKVRKERTKHVDQIKKEQKDM